VHIAIDIREACREQRTGKGQWAYGFLRELLSRPVRVVGYADGTVPRFDCDPSLFTAHVFKGGGLPWHWRVARHVRHAGEADAYVSPTSYIVPFLLAGRFPSFPVVHDLIAFRGEPHDRRATFIERATLGRTVIAARRIFTVSAATKRDLLGRFPALAAGNVLPLFAGPMRDGVPPTRPDGRTILCIATLSPRKNQKRLIEAFARLPQKLRERHRLVLAGGRGWMDDEIVALAQSTPGVEWRGYVTEGEYESLLSTCAVFALPSLYEGFGMQILDALQRGIPVLTSDRGSLREVCGNAAIYADPESVSSIATGLELLLGSERVRFDLHDSSLRQAKNFSWKRTVDLFLDALKSMN
jgi:glycosyltransferase involved in cell wall biosynthesis